MEKLSSTKPLPGVPKVGDRCDTGRNLHACISPSTDGWTGPSSRFPLDLLTDSQDLGQDPGIIAHRQKGQ